ncbi:uncharacterized protein LOC128251909 [Drosophila gunungcola]|uniref:uncharacterized protein LOC128251909 n=1 Tax=Drosophila gunungcola TaxID=103775 RepID=UPI0022E33E36|nr:uncharacterized protein LOC128251909 [Drosophila gunungcola]
MNSKYMLISGFVLLLLLFITLAEGQGPGPKSHALSVASMASLLETEKKLIDNLEEYANALEKKLQVFLGYIPIVQKENQSGRLDAISYLGNPLNGFSLIRRLHQDWPKWQKYLKQPVGTVQLRNFKGWRKDLPQKADLWDACAGIARIQNIYDLKVEDIIRGKLNGKQFNASMSSADIFAVGQHLVKTKQSTEAFLWLQEVYPRLQEELPIIPAHLLIGEIEVLKLLPENYLAEDLHLKALTLLENYLKLYKHNAKFLRLWQKTKDLIKSQNKPSLKKNKQPEGLMARNLMLSCKGLLGGSTRLHCVYNFSTTPFLRLAPLKMEQIGLDPYVVLYHDVIYPQESAQLIDLAVSDLRVSGTVKINDSNKKRMRTVKARWVKKELNKLTRRITRRIRDMTGLDLTDSEKFQIINYGIGGHYNMHKDYFNITTTHPTKNSMSEFLGNRLATVLFYLTDVEQGGATVFPASGYTVYPQAGSAVFWYNLHTDGKGDPSTLHAACPVIVGSKWVMSEWISERSQVFLRPCRLAKYLFTSVHIFKNTYMALREQQWMLLRGFLVATLFLTSLAFGNCPVERSQSLSLVTMVPLLDLELKLIENLNNYTKALELKLHIVRSHIDVMRAENEKGRLDPIAYLSNPLNGFSLIRRLYQDWSKWRKYMEQPVGILQIQNLDNLLVELPSKLDLWDACAGIIRIQSTYNLGIGDFTSGKLDGKQYNVSMSSADIFAVGQHLLEEKSSREAFQWLQEVPRRLKNELLPEHLAIGEVEVLKLLAELHVNHKNYAEALSLLDNCLKLRPHDAAVLRLRLKTLCFIESQLTPKKTLKTPFVEEYKLSCRGISERSSRLHCFYNFTTTPFLRLAPLKTEQIGLDPYIVLYHEVLSKREMSLLISRASRKMKVATIYKSTTKNKKKGRTAKGHWFNKENNELTRRISRRIHDMTGFDLTDSEEFQVINYGIGGHFHTHSDYFNFASANFTGNRNRQGTVLGDRIATVLFYLTDVEQGGATVFEKTGYAVYPRAGRAIFWFNLNTNGYGDPRTRHAACPVIVGSKWVMTEWIREWRQMFIRPCLPRAKGTSSKLNRTKS